MGAGRRTARPSGRRLRATLNQVEKALAAEDPGLASAFSIFTRLTDHEAMPGTERALPRRRMARWRTRVRRWRTREILILAAVMACLGALVSVTAAFGAHPCSMTTAPHQSATHTASCQAARRP